MVACNADSACCLARLIDFECVRSKKLLVFDGLCSHSIPPLTGIVRIPTAPVVDMIIGRKRPCFESFAGLRMLSHLFGVLRFEGFEEDVALFAKVRG